MKHSKQTTDEKFLAAIWEPLFKERSNEDIQTENEGKLRH